MLTVEADREIEEIIDERLGSKTLRDQVGMLMLEKSIPSDECASTTLIEHPSWLIKKPNKYTQELEALSTFAYKYGYKISGSGLSNFMKNMESLLALSRNTQNAPLQKNTLVRYTNEGLLHSCMQHVVKTQHREARTGGSLVDMNYSLLELIEQGDASNYHLDIISTEIEETNEHLVDLKYLVEDFSNIVEAGFASVVASLNQVSNEIALTRAAVVAELHHLEQTAVNIGNTIKREVAYGNRLLERMVWLERNSHKNDAQQFFEDGFKCLKRAATRADVEDAHAAFDDGTKKVRSSVENQYGAGLTDEFLDNFDEAAERYLKAANRSIDDSQEIASISLEGLARINQKQNNLPEAIIHSAKAVELDSDNLPACYDHARYLALSGQTDEVLEILIELIPRDEKYFHRMIVDSAFQYIEIQKLEEKLWDGKLVRSPTVLRQILLDFLILDDVDRAFDIFCYLFQFYPRSILHPKIWIPELIEKIKNQAESFFQKLITKEISSVSQRYAKTLILAQFNVPNEILMGTFLKELEDDPAYYQKDVVTIRQNLRDNPFGDVEKLITKIQPLLTSELNWLKL
jgi:tetratricopeptide (TPR) repeat protein